MAFKLDHAKFWELVINAVKALSRKRGFRDAVGRFPYRLRR